MTKGVIAAVVLVLLLLWGISTRHSLATMNETMEDALNQLGIQIASRFAVLAGLLDLLKKFDPAEAQALRQLLESRRSSICPQSSPEDIRRQEQLFAGVLAEVIRAAEQHPELKTGEAYVQCMNALDRYDKMAQTSRLIYNDAVTRWNRELRLFPVCLIAGLLGFRPRGHLEALEEKTKPLGPDIE